MHVRAYQNTRTHTASSMKKPDDAWLLIIRLCMKIDWVPYETEKLLEHSISSFVFSCFNWTTWFCHFVKWRSHRSSLGLQKWINGCFYSLFCLRAHCHQCNYQCFCCHRCCFYHHCYHCNYQCYHHYLIFITTSAAIISDIIFVVIIVSKIISNISLVLMHIVINISILRTPTSSAANQWKESHWSL